MPQFTARRPAAPATNHHGETFGDWLAIQKDRDGLVGQLIAGMKADRRFPRDGSPEDVRRHLSAMRYVRGGRRGRDRLDGILMPGFNRFEPQDGKNGGIRPHQSRTSAAPSRVIDKCQACPRRALAAAIARTSDSYAALSRMLGRADRYLCRFVVDGHPRALREDEHRRLASFFGVDQRALGVRDLWADA